MVVKNAASEESCLLRIVHRSVNIVRGRQAPDRDLLPSLSYLIASAIVVTLRSLSVAGIVDLIFGLERVLGSHQCGALRNAIAVAELHEGTTNS